MPEMITDADARYALDLVDTICTEAGPGLPGSPQERTRAEIIRKELESHLGEGNVSIEEFSLAPDAFLGSQPVGALFMLAAALLNVATGRIAGLAAWVTGLAALVFSIVPVFLFIFQFLLASECIDPLFKKKQSVNVIGVLRRPETKNVRRLLILSGHHDSAWEDNCLRFLGYGFYFASTTMLIGYITMLVVSLIQMAGLATGHAAIVQTGTLGWGLLVYPIAPAIIFSLFFHRKGKNGGIVPGAVDNLSGSALAVAMCRFLVENPSCIPDETEIRFISFGCEEAGLRGSRRYVERHLDELRRLEARLLNYEMVAYPEITILTSDKNGMVKNSPEMVNSVVAAAQRAGVPYKVQAASLGSGTDGGSFSQAGLKATTLIPFKFPQQFVAFYHQRWDRPEVLTIEPLFNVLKLTLEWVRRGG